MKSAIRTLAWAAALSPCLHQAATASDWEYFPAPPGRTLRDVAILAPDDVWAVGSKPGVTPHPTIPQVLHWDGATWTEVPTPIPGVRSSRLDAVGVAANGEVWVAGHQELQTGFGGSVRLNLLVMRWTGAGWQLMDTPLLGPNHAGATIRTMQVVAADDIWFGGDWPGMALAMHWDGSSFTVHDTPVFGDGGGGTFGDGHGIESMSALASDDVWAVGGAGDGDSANDESNIFHWNGSTWEHVPGPTPGVYHRLFGVAAIAPDDVWAVGKNEPDGPFALHWDGSSWALDPLPGFVYPFGELDAVTAFASDDVWAAGTHTLLDPPDVARPLLMHYDGSSWTEMAPDPDGPDAGWFRGIDHLGTDLTWVVGATGPGQPHTQRRDAGQGCVDPQPYGVGKTTSTGSVPTLDWSGTPSVSSGDFELLVTDAVANQTGLAFFGGASAAIPFLGGTLYVQPPLVRMPVHTLDGSGATSYAIAVDPSLVGTTRYYQFWFRDPSHPDGTGVGLSGALEVRFCQ